MSVQKLSNPVVEIDGVITPIKPNSVEFTTGRGEKKVTTQAAGAGSVEMVYADDSEMKFSAIKMTLETTGVNIRDAIDLNDTNPHSIRMYEPGVTFNFNGAVITSDPNVSWGADGEIPLEWASDPVIRA